MKAKKILGTLAILGFLSHTAFAEDLLAKITNGAVSDTSEGVRVLSAEEEKQVVGGYQVIAGTTSDYNIGNSLRITEAMAIAVPSVFEISTGGVCDMGVSASCYIPNSELAYGTPQHYTSSKNRYKELMAATNNDPANQFIAFVVKRTINRSNPYRATVQYTTENSIVGLTSGGAIYKIRSNFGSNSITREMSYRYQQQLKNGMGF